jgi:hypothetical protein
MKDNSWQLQGWAKIMQGKAPWQQQQSKRAKKKAPKWIWCAACERCHNEGDCQKKKEQTR